MTELDNKKLQEEKVKLLSLVIGGSGVVFLLLGVFILTNMPGTMDLFDVDEQTAKMISWMFMGVGTLDLVLAKFFIPKMVRGKKNDGSY